MAEQITLDLRIRSKHGLRNVYSTLPGVDVVRRSDHETRASLELKGGKMPERDLEVFFGVSDESIGLILQGSGLDHQEQDGAILVIRP